MSFALTLIVAALSGFLSLCYEILWFRVYSFASGGSPTAFGLLLGYYLAGLAIGAYLSRVFCGERTGLASRRVLWTLCGTVFLANLVGYLVVPAMAGLITRVPWSTLLLLVALSASLFGATLPLISHLGIAPDGRAGVALSRVYLANILGSAAGSLVTGFVLTNVWPLRTIALGMALAGLVVTSALLALVRPSRRLTIGAASVLLASGVAFTRLNPSLFDRLYERLLFKEQYRGEKFADVVENREGVIAVTTGGRVYGGGAYDGAISTDLVDDRNIIVRAFGAVAMHPRARRVLMIGLSTGAWAKVIAASRDVEHMTVVEINPGYLRLIAKYPQVAGVLTDPKVNVVIDDGRRWLLRHPDEKFDLIIQNTTEHWRAHTTNLLSREYLGLIRAHLAPGGIYHFNTTSSEDAFKTAFVAFPHGMRFVNFATVSDSPVQLDSARWDAVLLRYRIDGRPVIDTTRAPDRARLDSLRSFAKTADWPARFFGLERREAMLAHLGSAGIITDDNMLPEWRQFVTPW